MSEVRPEYPEGIQPEPEQQVPIQKEKMLVIYFLDDGEIHQVAYGCETLEDFYGPHRAPQFGQILGGLSVEPSDYLFNQFQSFRVDIEDPHNPQLLLTEQAFRLLEIFNRTKNLY